MGKSSFALNALYGERFLREILSRASKSLGSKCGDIAFSEFQRETLKHRFKGLSFDCLTTSLVRCDADLLPEEADVLCLDIDERLAEGYGEVAHFDDVSPLSYLNSGRLINAAELRPYKEWLSHPFYLQHCKFFGIANSMTISFQHPELHASFLAFEYLSREGPGETQHVNHQELELASFPFAMAWFFRKGLMDDKALERRFQAMQGLTEAQLVHLRKYVKCPTQSFKHQAADLGISETWLKESLYNVRDLVSCRLDWPLSPGSKSTPSTLRMLDKEFRFMEMLGDAHRPLNTVSH